MNTINELMPVERSATGFLLVESPNGQEVLEIEYGVAGEWAVLQGDIILGAVADLERSTPERPHSYLIPARSHGGLLPEADIIVGAQFKWPSNTIYYDIDSNLPDPSRVTEAIAHWEANTPVRFVERSTGNYVHFQWDEKLMNSRMGMVGGKQLLLVPNWGSMGRVIHEIGHAFGFYHEQCRADRDKFINFYPQNLKTPKDTYAWRVIPSWQGATPGAYDYGSIMHYSKDQGARDGLDVLVPKVAGVEIGQRDGLSIGDIAAAYARCGSQLTFVCAFDESAIGVSGTESGVVQRTYDAGSAAQRWRFKQSGQTSYLIVDDQGNALRVSSRTQTLSLVQPDDTDLQQHWVVKPGTGSRCRIVNAFSGLALTIRGGFGNPDGRPILAQVPDPGSLTLTNQWTFSPGS